MAKAKKEENFIKVKALVNLKYDKECHVIDDEFKIRIEDAEKMVEKGYIELLEELSKEDEEVSGEEDNLKEGE